MSNMVSIIIICSVLFVLSIIGYSIIKEVSVYEATKAVAKMLKDIYKGLFDKEVSKPVLRLGTIDGIHFTVEQIYKVFDEVKQLFRTFILFDYKEQNNIIIYRFKAKFPHVEFDPITLIELITSIVEEEVNKVLHSHGIFTMTDSYVAVAYHNGILHIAVAKNEDGFNQIEYMKVKAREKMLSTSDNDEQTMTEEWKSNQE